METSDKDQLNLIRDAIFEAIRKSSAKTASLVGSGDINKEDQLKLAAKETQLQHYAKQLNFEFFEAVVADIKAPGERIKNAKNELNEAVDRLKTVNDFMGFFAKITNIVDTIIGAFLTNNPLKLTDLLAQIKSIG